MDTERGPMMPYMYCAAFSQFVNSAFQIIRGTKLVYIGEHISHAYVCIVYTYDSLNPSSKFERLNPSKNEWMEKQKNGALCALQ